MSLPRIPYDSACLAAVVQECQALVGARLQRVIQPSKDTVVLETYHRGDAWLLVSWSPVHARAYVCKRKPASPADLPGFCAALRKHVQGGRITSVRQRGFDRVLEVAVSTSEGGFLLVAELMGKHSNMVLLDSAGKILACGKSVGRSQSSRPVQTGGTYSPPPFEPRLPLTSAKPGDDLATFEGASPFLRRLIQAGYPLDQVTSLQFAPVDSPNNGAYPFDVALLGYPTVRVPNLSSALENEFEARIQNDEVGTARQALAAQLARVALARETALAGIAEAIATAHDAPRLQRLGELVLAYQGMVSPGADRLDAHDYDGTPVSIRLVADKSPVENANRYFDKAKHAKSRLGEVESQQSRLASELADVRSLLAKLDQALTLAEIEGLKADCEKRHWLHRKQVATAKEDRPYEGFPIRQLVSPGGWTVLYGTNATSNDYLTTKVAKGNDYWFHVRGQNSSHVVLVTQGQPLKVQSPDLVFAAQVSARNSPAKHSSHVPVDYTLKKYVRKPRASAPGAAVYEREKTLHVDP